MCIYIETRILSLCIIKIFIRRKVSLCASRKCILIEVFMWVPLLSRNDSKSCCRIEPTSDHMQDKRIHYAVQSAINFANVEICLISCVGRIFRFYKSEPMKSADVFWWYCLQLLSSKQMLEDSQTHLHRAYQSNPPQSASQIFFIRSPTSKLIFLEQNFQKQSSTWQTHTVDAPWTANKSTAVCTNLSFLRLKKKRQFTTFVAWNLHLSWKINTNNLKHWIDPKVLPVQYMEY